MSKNMEGLLNFGPITIPVVPDLSLDCQMKRRPVVSEMPAWGLTPPQRIMIPPDRPDVEQALRSVCRWRWEPLK